VKIDIFVNATELKAAFSLAIIYVLRMLGLFMVMPVLAILTVDYSGFSAWHVGLAIGGYGLTQAILQIPFGMLSDKLGRKPVIVLGLMLFAVGSLIAGVAEDMTTLIIGRVLQGAGAIAGAVMALAADVTREEHRTKVMAIIGIAIGCSFYLALLLGPILADDYGLSGLFLITAALSVFGIALVVFVVPSAVNIAPSAETLPRKDFVLGLLRHKELSLLNISVCLLHLFITILFIQIPTLLTDLGVGLEAQWTVYLPVLLASIIGLIVLMGAARKQAKAVMSVSIVMMISCFAGLALFDGALSLYSLCALILVFFIGFNYLEANTPALVSSIAPAGKKGTAMGIYASFQFFGAFLGGMISGLMTSSFSINALYTVCIGLGIVWLILILSLHSQPRVKRVTLTINLQNKTVAELATSLGALAGVKDITIVAAEQAAYLKVDAKTFEIAKARAVLQ
jgi:MFS family permease